MRERSERKKREQTHRNFLKRKQIEQKTREKKRAHTVSSAIEKRNGINFHHQHRNITNTHCENVAYCIGRDGSARLQCIERWNVQFEFRIFVCLGYVHNNHTCCAICETRYYIIMHIEYGNIWIVWHCTRVAFSPTTNFPTTFSRPVLQFVSRNAACVLRYVDKQSAIRSRKTRYDGKHFRWVAKSVIVRGNGSSSSIGKCSLSDCVAQCVHNAKQSAKRHKHTGARQSGKAYGMRMYGLKQHWKCDGENFVRGKWGQQICTQSHP